MGYCSVLFFLHCCRNEPADIESENSSTRNANDVQFKDWRKGGAEEHADQQTQNKIDRKFLIHEISFLHGHISE